MSSEPLFSELNGDQLRRYFEARVKNLPARASGSGEVSIRCPFHHDRDPSLSLNLSTGLWYCHAERKGGNIVDFEMALTNCDSNEAIAAICSLTGERPNKGAWRRVARYEYQDAQTKPVFEILREEKGEGEKRKKQFSCRHRAPDGRWVYNLDGIKRIPYRLPEVILAKEVFIVEGEKCVHALASVLDNCPHPEARRGVAVTCNPLGGGKWHDDFSPFFTGKKVVVLPDNDKPGIAHAQQVAKSLAKFAYGIKVVNLFPDPPSEKHGLDVGDYLAAGGTLDSILQKIKAAPEWQPSPEAVDIKKQQGILLTDVVSEVVTFLWQGRIPLGKLTMVEGDPGLGKSTLTLDIAARVTTGRAMPDESPGVHGGVLLLTAEDGLADTVKPRLEAAGADLARVIALTTVNDDTGERMLSIPDDLGVIEETASRISAKLIVIDPLMAYLGPKVNSFKDQDIRRALAPLAQYAERTGTAIVILGHLNKAEGQSAMYRGGGSIAINAAARSVLIVGKDPEDGDRRVLASVKSNIGPASESLAYRIETAENGVGRIVWEGPSPLGADALLAVGLPQRDTSALQEAKDFLLEELADGPKSKQEIQAAAEQNGIAPRTLRRASKALKVIARPTGYQGAWMWSSSEESSNESTKLAQLSIPDLANSG